MSWHKNLPWNQDRLQHLLELAANKQLGHAYLLQGQQGLGKESLAMDFAQQIFCRNRQAGQACDHCQGCRLFAAGTHPDFKVLRVEEDSTQIKIEQVRGSLNFLANTPLLGESKILLINPAEALNANAANALLKNLEEPAPGTVLFLVSHQPGRLLPTIRSRCQQMKFSRPETKAALDFLQQTMPPRQAERILVMAGGAPLKALEYANENKLDQARAVHKSLLQLMQSESDMHNAIITLTSVGPAFVLENMLLGVYELIRHLQAMPQKPAKGKSRDPVFSTAELEELSGLLHVEQLQELHLFYHELSSARAQMQSTANPNGQLILESLCCHWVGGMREGHKKSRLKSYAGAV